MKKQEISLVILKPDAIKSFIGEIFLRLEKTNLKRSAIKVIMATPKQCMAHYNKDEKWFLEKGTKIIENIKKSGQPIKKDPIEYGKEIIKKTTEYLTSDLIIVMVFEGYCAVNTIKKIVGTTEPITSPQGTIRGDLGKDSYYQADLENRSLQNLIHCSDQVDEALREITIWFSKEEIHNLNLNGYFI